MLVLGGLLYITTWMLPPHERNIASPASENNSLGCIQAFRLQPFPSGEEVESLHELFFGFNGSHQPLPF